jgi:hypothetical protein
MGFCTINSSKGRTGVFAAKLLRFTVDTKSYFFVRLARHNQSSTAFLKISKIFLAFPRGAVYNAVSYQ